jgi:methylenetetrahydrofolate dehydrogenase (NADP+)/methenyltetrahydrofolate cyclohydrolase
MSARSLEGRPVADAIWNDVEQRLARLADRIGRAPALAIIGGTDRELDPDLEKSAAAYGRQIERQFTRHGLGVNVRTAAADQMLEVVRGLSDDAAIDAILLLTPLPPGVDTEQAILAIDPAKDVDGQHPANLGRLAQRRTRFAPATALGGLRLLQHYAVPLRGAQSVVVGRSPVVGMPLSLLLVDADATVTVCHSRTVDLERVTREADLLCVAIGRQGFIGPAHVKPGAVVLDFGTHPGEGGAMLGDVQTEAVSQIAGAITPVPGGTGPTTVSVLAQQTVQAAELRHA